MMPGKSIVKKKQKNPKSFLHHPDSKFHKHSAPTIVIMTEHCFDFFFVGTQ